MLLAFQSACGPKIEIFKHHILMPHSMVVDMWVAFVINPAAAAASVDDAQLWWSLSFFRTTPLADPAESLWWLHCCSLLLLLLLLASGGGSGGGNTNVITGCIVVDQRIKHSCRQPEQGIPDARKADNPKVRIRPPHH
jgi:hypothetical protein